MSDFVITDHGTIVLLTPLTPAAEEWVDQHIGDDAQLWGSNSIVVEPRYIADIVEGIRNDGLGIARSATVACSATQ